MNIFYYSFRAILSERNSPKIGIMKLFSKDKYACKQLFSNLRKALIAKMAIKYFPLIIFKFIVNFAILLDN